MDFNDIDFQLKAIMLLGVLTPFATAIIAKMRTPDWWKGLISITLSAGVGIVSALFDAPDGSTIEWSTAVANGFGVYLLHLASYFGITSDMVHRLNRVTSAFGIGPPRKLSS